MRVEEYLVNLPEFSTASEHSIRFSSAHCGKIVHHDSNVAFSPTDY